MKAFPEFKLDKNTFLNRTVALYGASKSGKSYIIVDIMEKLKKDIPLCIVFCATDSQTGTYGGKLVPKQFVHETITKELIEQIVKRQEKIKRGVGHSNKKELVETLYLKILSAHPATDEIRDKVEKIEKFRIADQTSSGTDTYAKLAISSMQSFIVKNSNYLDRSTLTDSELCALEYMCVNPNILLIFDDCTDQLKKLNSCDAFKKLFYQGRHLNITILLACHDDTALFPAIRQNTFYSIFTSLNTATTYFSRSTSPLTPQRRKDIMPVIEKTIIGYQKLVYNRDSDEFYRYKAGEHQNFRFCDDLVWHFADIIKNDDMGMSLTDLLR